MHFNRGHENGNLSTFWGSDDCSIEFKLKLKFQRPERSCRLVYNYRAADWLGLREDVCNL